MYKCGIKYIDEKINILSNLQFLVLNNNKISDLPKLTNLKKLNIMKIYNNPLIFNEEEFRQKYDIIKSCKIINYIRI